jgi:phage-related protein (TIGR01555 family)
MTTKTSVRAAARDAKAQEKKAQTALLHSARTGDSFVNFAHKLGIGADNALSQVRYGFNPITRNRMELEWMHRGSWLSGLAIDVVADDMTRAGVDFVSEMNPEDQGTINRTITKLGVWDKLGECVRWGRLYGGAIAVMMVDGQDMRTPLNTEAVALDGFRGLIVFDRWMLDPDLSDLVTEMGPDIGMPKFYKVLDSAPAMRGVTIHYSRIALRHVGIELPYHQALTENLWGESVLERMFDRMAMFDSASTGAGQLVYKAWLRTLKIKDMRSIVAAGGAPMEGLMKYVDVMRRYQGIEGITLLDGEDEFEVQEHGAFSGLSDVVMMFAQQVSGALQIPLVRLLGQSPAGLNSTGESDLRTYYDNILQQQNRLMHRGINAVYEMVARSEGVNPDDSFGVDFASLWQMSTTEKGTHAKTVSDAVNTAYEKGTISQQVAVKELRQVSKVTGVFSNISQEDIDAADEALALPPTEQATQELDAQQEHEQGMQESSQEHQARMAEEAHQRSLEMQKEQAKNARQNGQAGPVAGGARKRNRL